MRHELCKNGIDSQLELSWFSHIADDDGIHRIISDETKASRQVGFLNDREGVVPDVPTRLQNLERLPCNWV